MISEKFTIEDIHKIRYENYERTKSMSTEELLEYTEKEAKKGRRIIEELREKRRLRNAETQ